MNLQIEERHLEIIKDILKNVNASVYVFGSRASGRATKYSDLDLAIDCYGKKLPDELSAKLAYMFENSTLPYKVDIVDLNAISEEFKNNIKDDFIKLST